jgi:tetratricopeptide (TPR) repeat protein
VSYVEEHFDKSHRLVATAYIILATEYSEHEENDKSYEFYQKVLKILADVFGTEHIDEAKVYNGIANIHRSKGELDVALDYLKKAQAIYEKVSGVDYTYIAATLQYMAGVH